MREVVSYIISYKDWNESKAVEIFSLDAQVNLNVRKTLKPSEHL